MTRAVLPLLPSPSWPHREVWAAGNLPSLFLLSGKRVSFGVDSLELLVSSALPLEGSELRAC